MNITITQPFSRKTKHTDNYKSKKHANRHDTTKIHININMKRLIHTNKCTGEDTGGNKKERTTKYTDNETDKTEVRSNESI